MFLSCPPREGDKRWENPDAHIKFLSSPPREGDSVDVNLYLVDGTVNISIVSKPPNIIRLELCFYPVPRVRGTH